MSVANVIVKTLHRRQAKCSVFIYSLSVKSMYNNVNKATFRVVEIIKPIYRNTSKSTINTTSLSDNIKLSSLVATHTSAFTLALIVNTIQYFLTKINMKRTSFRFFLKTKELNKIAKLF